MGAWLGGRPAGPRGPAWSRPAATVFWGTRVLGCVGGVSSLAANSGVWGRSWEHPWSGFVFLSETPLRWEGGRLHGQRNRRQTARSEAPQRFILQNRRPGQSWCKSRPPGSGGEQGPASGGVPPRSLRESGSCFVTCVPPPLASTPFREKEDQVLGADRPGASQVHPQSSDGPTLRSGLSLSDPSGGRTRPEPTHGQLVCPLFLNLSSCWLTRVSAPEAL